MSVESAKSFLKKIAADKELQEKLKGVDSEEKFFTAAKEAAFDFTKEEWLAVAPIISDRDLSDGELGNVSAARGNHDGESRHRDIWRIDLSMIVS